MGVWCRKSHRFWGGYTSLYFKASTGSINRLIGEFLLLEGENDYFLRVSKQLDKTQRGLTNARSIATVIFKDGEGSAKNCQIGAIMKFQAELFK